MPRNPNAEPKPFVLIEIPSRAPERKPATTHEKFAGLTGRLELTFTVVSEYLFVGSGAYGFDPNARGDRPDVWYTFYRCNGRLCVPGTSIKGAIRAIVESDLQFVRVATASPRADKLATPPTLPASRMKKVLSALLAGSFREDRLPRTRAFFRLSAQR
jgi:CRISPR/Cas system CSM-associated protein Csm3 (group 7 of RAMP superfamily)